VADEATPVRATRRVTAPKEFQNLARVRISDLLKQRRAVELAELLLGSDWIRVFPGGMSQPMSGPLRRPDSILFEPGHWPELSSAAATLHSTLGDCHRAYQEHCAAYDRLTDDERQIHASKGRPQP
jgi:hypothetical protein